MKYVSTLMLTVVALLSPAHRPWAFADEQINVRRVSVTNIGRSIQLVGRLGVPLGEKMTITGYWHFPAKPHVKDDTIRFTVTVVNGKTLDKPVEFNRGQVEFSDKEHHNIVPEFKKHRELENQEWTLIAYETGRIQMFPNEFHSDAPVFPIVGRPYYSRPFTSEIVGVLVRNNGRTKR